MENAENLTRDLNLQDYVIFIGGSNDIYNNKIPSFRDMCSKLKLCINTNILFSSIPLDNRNKNMKERILKYNLKLNNFLSKFNNYMEGRIQYADINDKLGRKLTYNAFAELVSHYISTNACVGKNLIFIKIDYNYVSSAPAGANTVQRQEAMPIVESASINQNPSEEHFLDKHLEMPITITD